MTGMHAAAATVLCGTAVVSTVADRAAGLAAWSVGESDKEVQS